MAKENKWLAAVFVTAAVGIGIHSFQSSTPSVSSTDDKASVTLSSPSATKPAIRQSAKDAAELAKGPCADLEQQFQTFFATSGIAAPESCYPPNSKTKVRSHNLVEKTKDLHFVIAVLPDPLHTHFSLTFDRYAEAIQQGAQDQHYIYDSSWLPWDTEKETYPLRGDKLAAEDRRQAQEEQPGIILFRQQPPTGVRLNPNDAYQNGLAVFVVGEEATAGIHRKQFQNALDWIYRLNPRMFKELTIIGPSFSGSLPSLAELLSGALHKNQIRTIGIFSGGITGSGPVKQLMASLNDQFKAVSPGRPRVLFQSFQQNDEYEIQNYCRFLLDAGGSMDRVAIISEDETAFGAAAYNPGSQITGASCAEVTNLSYPRDISSLRAAYQNQSLFTSGTAGGDPDVVRHTLKTNLADPEGNQHDTIRSYSGTQTALSQESELQQLVRMLKFHNSEYIILRSSNPLDQVFLTQYLQQQFPEGRIVVTSADLLLARDMDASGINGIMTLSNYPLLPEEQDWTATPPAPHSHRAFINSETEGTYIATRVVLGGAVSRGVDPFAPPFFRANSTPADQDIRDYSLPFWEHQSIGHRPPTWIAVLGRGGLWPVAAMGDDKQDYRTFGECVTNELKSIFFLHGHYSRDDLMGRGLAMPISLTITILVVVLWSLFHLWCCVYPTITVKPGFFAHFATAPFSASRVGRQRALIVVGSAIIGIASIVIGWGMGSSSASWEVPVYVLNFRCLLTFVWWATLLGVALNALMERRLSDLAAANPPIPAPIGFWKCLWNSPASGNNPIKGTWSSAWKPCVCYLTATFFSRILLVALLEPALHDYNRIPTYIRSMNITSGVSPIAPLLILLAGLYLWFWFTLQGQALLGEDRPLLPKNSVLRLPLTPAPASAKLTLLTSLSRGKVARPIEAWCDWISSKVKKTFAVALTLVICVFCAFGYPPLRSLGSSRYSDLCFGSIALCAGILITNTWQLQRIWLLLRNVLDTLDRLPLRRTIDALHGFSWGSIWEIGGSVLDERYKLSSRQTESLNHFQQSLAEFAAKSPNGGDILRAQTSTMEIVELRKRTIQFWEWYGRSWYDWGARDSTFTQRVLQNESSRMAGNMIVKFLVPYWRLEGNSLVADYSNDPRPSGIPEVREVAPHILAAEEFVCLIYLGFVQNVLGRIRSLVLGIVVLFVALALGITSYPFDPRPLLNGFIVILFLVLGFFLVRVYAQMYRNATLSRLTNTKPGELGGEFWLKLFSFGIGPLFSLLASIFPAFANFFFSWMQPSLSALK